MKRRRFLGRGLAAAAGALAGTVPARWLAGGALRSRDLDLSFLRGPGPGEISLMATGDSILYRSLERLSGPGFDELFRVQRECDVAVTNCELVFARSGYPKPKDVAYRPPEVADEFVWQGIDMVSLANNHTMDLGPEGMRETIAALEERGIVHAGAGESLDDATRPAVVVRNGIRVGLLSFLCMSSRVAVESAAGEDEPGLASIPGHRVRVAPPGGEARRLVAPEDAALTAMEQAIRRARSLADVVLVAYHMHWGDRHEVDEGRKIIARAAVDAGADLVFAHGPHVINPVERYRDRLIFYSLGNFFFHIFEDDWFSADYGASWPGITKGVYSFTTSTDFWEGLAPRFVLGRDGVRSVQILPVVITRSGDPHFPRPERGRAIVEDLRTISRGMGAELELGEWHAEARI